jgi:hypothetical protein
MNPLVTIPRQALAELLQAAGSTLTPEEYLATLSEADPFKRYKSRAWAAAISKYGILVIAILSVVLLPLLGFTFENIIIVVGLITVTFFEFRVHKYFLENNPKAPSLGYRNQSAFAAAILIYCLYSAFAPVQLSADDMNMIEQNNVIDPGELKNLAKIFYLGIAVIAGGSQYALAVYYRGAEIRPKV